MTKTKTTTTGALRYIGDGSALDDVPARDLSADEVERYDRTALLASGLYEPAPNVETPPESEA